MHKITRVVTIVGMAATLCVAIPVFAESAPVFDADAVQQQLDNNDQNQDYPPSPGGQEVGQSEAAQSAQQAFEAGPAPGPADQGPSVAVEASGGAPSMSLSQRLHKVEQQINNMQSTDAATRVDQLQSQIQALRGQVEELTHQVQQAQAQQKSMYDDLDKRLQATLSTKPAQVADTTSAASPTADAAQTAAATVVPKGKKGKMAKSVIAAQAATQTAPQAKATANGNQPSLADEQQAYQNVYNLIKAKKYNEAVNVLQTMLKKYPSGQFASNAHYWLGELYTSMSKSDQALTEFNAVIQTYPDSPRVSEAQLKIGLILASQTKWSDARLAFKNVISHYPGTASAQVATQQLKQLKQAGH